ncbi:anthranilate phosphoribosyltransferase [Sorangium cellulosum]|uniref:Anthranilate phosphoribosyltransferase n=2 Tax=Polyangiaceae TaxID=49 RepID=A0A4P2PVF4_SORCE|nr:anthranilate phosphoribosyltransferase [Sorangium cellulosum]AUX20610.1 anthranilate phosphoribosyltransferase [Sorangium cellulosum]
MMHAVIDALCAGVDLSVEQAEALFRDVVAGALTEVELSALLVALKAKGETPAEIAGAARALRAASAPFERPAYVYADCCGTGGDGQRTVNVSTAVAFVTAEAGLPVAKHGNRSVSSQCGSADVLEALGARLDPPADVSRRALDEAGFCFLFAPQYHAGLRHAMPVRRALKVRTIMNLLGPLVNPSAPSIQVMGIYDPELVSHAARTLGMLGCQAALVVHGGGLDEIALHAPTRAALLRDGVVEELTLEPADAGVTPAPIEALRGSGPAANAAWLRGILEGRGEPAHMDAVAINAGALLWISGRAATLREGTAAALDVLRSGRAGERLTRFVALSREGAQDAAKEAKHG